MRRSLVLRAAGVLALVLSARLGGDWQGPPAEQSNTGAISGIVRDAGTGAPIADVIVELARIGDRDLPQTAQQAATDERGRFVFLDLPAGPYTVVARKSGYFDAWFGAPAEGGTHRVISLHDGRWVSTADIAMSRPGSLSGTVVDERGEPLVGVFVRLLGRPRIAGRDRLAAGPLAVTDDRGVYRFSDLQPGRYLVMVPSVQASYVEQPAASAASNAPAPPAMDVDAATRLVLGHYPVPPPPVNGQWFTYPPAFAGATSIAQAPSYAVEAGVERTGVDVRLDPVPAVRISGTVAGPPDALTDLVLRLIPDGLEDLGLGAEAATCTVAPDGSFTFVNVPAGSYTIDAPAALNEFLVGRREIFYSRNLPRPPGMRGFGGDSGPIGWNPRLGFFTAQIGRRTSFARARVTAGAGGAANVLVRLTSTVTMTGRIVVELDPSVPAPETLPTYVSLETSTGDPQHGRVTSVSPREVPAGEFRIEGIVPGRYLFRGSSGAWTLKSVVVGGRDYTFTPIDLSDGGAVSNVIITFTNAAPSLTGTARAGARAASDAIVIAFPVEREQWTEFGLSPVRIRTALTSTTSEYRFARLPAGDYFVVAVPAARAGAWREDGFFQRMSGLATRVSLQWGQRQTADVPVIDRW